MNQCDTYGGQRTVIGIIGENCSGKSTLAEAIQKDIHAEIVTGKDYLRMAESESEAADPRREDRAVLHPEEGQGGSPAALLRGV